MKSAKHTVFSVGLASTVYGIWLVWHPLGWIFGGLALIGLSLLVDRLSGNQ